MQKSALPSRLSFSNLVGRSVGVEVLMAARNKTKRPSVTRPNRAHYNNSFSRTPSSYSMHEPGWAGPGRQAQGFQDLPISDCVARLHLN